MEKKYRVVVKASCEDTLCVVAKSEEEAINKIKTAFDETAFDVCGYCLDNTIEYVGGYTTEPEISVEGWRVIKTA